MRNPRMSYLAAAAGLFALAACGGGGGGMTAGPSSGTGSNSASGGGTTTGSSSGTGSNTALQDPYVIEPVDQAWITTATLVKPGTPTSFPVASGTSPNFGANLPPTGTVFPLEQTGATISHSPAANGVTPSGFNSGVQLTFSGMQTVNGTAIPTFEMTIPDYNVDAKGVLANGSTVTLADGRTVTLQTQSLNYTLFAAWAVAPLAANGNANQIGVGISGYQTPASGVPASGTATYLGNNTSGALGGVQGAVLTASGSTLPTASVTGQASLSVNFGTQAVNGSLTNMIATAATGGATSQWNDVNLNGALSGSTISGTTSTPAAVGGTFGFSASSTGTIRGALFGPHGEELGLVWVLNDRSAAAGKSAFGFVGASKQ